MADADARFRTAATRANSTMSVTPIWVYIESIRLC
jgi:hypothetical protein